VVFRRNSSPQTSAVLACLLVSSGDWRHGYDLARQTGLASGTLYPILGRLSDGGLLETRWEDDPPEGRPRRHLYRLTAEGAALAATAAEQTAEGRGARARASRRGRPAVEGA
jgi:PadR family transcriptional regulator, regulatory protein PadR